MEQSFQSTEANIFDNMAEAHRYQWILDRLPYDAPFRFVDEITEVSDDRICGLYHFHEQHEFYAGHFRNNPVTPGVILSETMAQIGLVALGIYMMRDEDLDGLQIGLTSIAADFYHPVLPREIVRVESVKTYFRFNKLKCACKMYNQENKLVCKADIAGMMIIRNNE